MRYLVNQRQQGSYPAPFIRIRTLKVLPTREDAEAFLLSQSDSFYDRVVAISKRVERHNRFNQGSHTAQRLRQNERQYKANDLAPKEYLPHYFIEERP